MTKNTTTSRKATAERAARKSAEKAPTPKITVATSELKQAITRVKPFICPDDTLPMINGIALQLANGILTVVATDRFTIGANILHPKLDKGEDGKLSTLPDDFEVIIRKHELPILTAVINRTPTLATNTIDLLIDGGQIIVDGVRIGDPAVTGSFPNWRKHVLDTESLLAAGPPEFHEVAVNPTYLRRFTSIRPAVTFRVASQTRPSIATSNDFIGLIMPLRVTQSRSEVLAEFGIKAGDAA